MKENTVEAVALAVTAIGIVGMVLLANIHWAIPCIILAILVGLILRAKLPVPQEIPDEKAALIELEAVSLATELPPEAAHEAAPKATEDK